VSSGGDEGALEGGNNDGWCGGREGGRASTDTQILKYKNLG